jgi:hypothetical protein
VRWYDLIVLTAVLALLLSDEGPKRLDVTVGKTIETDVGIAIGVRCDDLTLVDVAMKTKDATNVFVVKGLREGTTLCRVGTAPAAASILFEVRVRR